jgi:glycopeptide antibiotics resistance protein
MKLFRFWKSACWFILILFVTFLPGSSSNRIKLFIHADKLIHLSLFFIFSLLLIFDAKKFFQTSSIQKNIFIAIALTGMVVGLFTELVQYFFIADRSGTVGDLAADVCGILIGIGIYRIIIDRSKS